MKGRGHPKRALATSLAVACCAAATLLFDDARAASDRAADAAPTTLAPERAPPLPNLHADPDGVSVSGLSSGGFMAVQYATAYSASVGGVAVVAGGPYDCAVAAFGDVEECQSGRPSGARAWLDARRYAALGLIDPAANIARQRVYLFSGTRDRTVLPRIVAATRDYYRAAGVPAAGIADVHDLPAGHAFLSPTAGNACGTSTSPFVERCLVGGQPYDQPKAILAQMQGARGPLQPAATRLSATIRPFDQREFAGPTSSFDTTGWIYVPAACTGTSALPACRVHVVFHGCRQGAESVGDAVHTRLGFNRWADTNRIVVLYPQVVKSDGPFPYNPRGCWDWWGSFGLQPYTGPAFMLKSGVQPAAVKAMVDRLTGR